jgi:hypothetical protein
VFIGKVEIVALIVAAAFTFLVRHYEPDHEGHFDVDELISRSGHVITLVKWVDDDKVMGGLHVLDVRELFTKRKFDSRSPVLSVGYA